MAMENNPFYIEPAKGYGDALVGLGAILLEARQQKIAQAKEKEMQDAIGAALDSADPDEINRVAIQYPDFTDTIYRAMNINDDSRKAALAADMREMITSSPERIPSIFERRIQEIEAADGDSSHTRQAYQEFLANPDAELAQMRLIYPSLVSSQEYEEYKRMTETPEPPRANTDLGKLREDFVNNLITEDEFIAQRDAMMTESDEGISSADESLMFRQTVELLGGLFDAQGNIQALDPSLRNKVQEIVTRASVIKQSNPRFTRSQAVTIAATELGIDVFNAVQAGTPGNANNDPLGIR